MIFLLIGCASLFYEGRLWRCDTEERTPTFIADGPIQVRDAGFQGQCRVGAYGRYFPRPYDEDENDLFIDQRLQLFEEVDEVEFAGVNLLNIAWGQGFAESEDMPDPNFEGGTRETRIDLASRVATSEGPTLATTVQLRATNSSVGKLSWDRAPEGAGATLTLECTYCSVQINGVSEVHLTVRDGAYMRVCGAIDASITTEGGLVEFEQGTQPCF